MSYVQEIGIVHRDLKSSNVLLETVPINEKQSTMKAVLCDFGLAKITSSASTLQGMKIKDIGGLSPRYAAPEVFADMHLKVASNPDSEMKSDVYSFAIVIWELLSRKIPWEGFDHSQIERAVRSGDRPFIPAIDENNPAAVILVELMRVCWHDQPSIRPSFTQIYNKLISLL